MAHKGPHISISPDYVVNRILRINISDFEEWPESVRHLAIAIAEELFLVAYNPFIDADTVRASVRERFEREALALAHYYATAISEGITMFWSAYEAEADFRQRLVETLRGMLPAECVLTHPAALVETATDATDLRMELPLLVVEPDNTEQVAALVKLANDMKFALIPRGGGSGATGGAVPARRRTVIVSLARLTHIGPIDLEAMTVTCQAGANTQAVITAVDEKGALFSVDPASKQASSIGGNVSENAGGPMAFEYGTTLDNLLWWRMVTPTGEIITVERENHPRHKILPEETAVFVVKDVSGGVRNVVHLRGDEIRLPGLGKGRDQQGAGRPARHAEGRRGRHHHRGLFHPASQAALQARHGAGILRALHASGGRGGARAREPAQPHPRRRRLRASFRAGRIQRQIRAGHRLQAQIPQVQRSALSVIILQVDGDDPYLLDKCVGDIVSVVEEQENVDIIVRRTTRKPSASGRPPPPVRHRQAHVRLQAQRGRGHPHGPHPGFRSLP